MRFSVAHFLGWQFVATYSKFRGQAASGSKHFVLVSVITILLFDFAPLTTPLRLEFQSDHALLF